MNETFAIGLFAPAHGGDVDAAANNVVPVDRERKIGVIAMLISNRQILARSFAKDVTGVPDVGVRVAGIMARRASTGSVANYGTTPRPDGQVGLAKDRTFGFEVYF